MKLTDAQTALVCRSMSLLLHSGISLGEGLYLLARELGPDLAPVLETMDRTMTEGAPLPQAMEDSGAFPAAAVGLVTVAEETGRMEQTLSYLADYYEEQDALRYEIRRALTYPGILFLLMLGVLGVLLTEVLPVFDAVYASLGTGLTGVAAGLLRLGSLLKAGLPALAGLLAVGLLAAGACRYIPPVRRQAEKAFLAGAGDRWILKKSNNALFAHAMALGMSSGIQAEEAVALSCVILAPIPAAAARCGRCRTLLREGMALHEALEETALLPGTESRMLALGIRSGSADRVMEDIARRLSQEARRSAEEAAARLEPAMVLICAGLVGLVLLAVMLPLMNLLAGIG